MNWVGHFKNKPRLHGITFQHHEQSIKPGGKNTAGLYLVLLRSGVVNYAGARRGLGNMADLFQQC